MATFSPVKRRSLRNSAKLRRRASPSRRQYTLLFIGPLVYTAAMREGTASTMLHLMHVGWSNSVLGKLVTKLYIRAPPAVRSPDVFWAIFTVSSLRLHGEVIDLNSLFCFRCLLISLLASYLSVFTAELSSLSRVYAVIGCCLSIPTQDPCSSSSQRRPIRGAARRCVG